mgnify:CR=1 FL=1
MDFNLFPLLPINYTSSYCPNMHSHTYWLWFCERVRGSSVYLWWYQQYQNSNLSLIQCLFIMHFNYVKTHPLSHKFGQLREDCLHASAVVATSLLCYKTERRPPYSWQTTTGIEYSIAFKLRFWFFCIRVVAQSTSKAAETFDYKYFV